MKRWAQKKEAIARGEIPPAIGRYASKDKKTTPRAKSATVENQPEIAPPQGPPPTAGSGTSTFKIPGYGKRVAEKKELNPASFYGGLPDSHGNLATPPQGMSLPLVC